MLLKLKRLTLIILGLSFQNTYAYQECISEEDFTNTACMPIEHSYPSSFTLGHIPYTVYGSSYDLIDDISPDGRYAAAVMAVGTWKEQANSGHVSTSATDSVHNFDILTQHYLPKCNVLPVNLISIQKL